MKIKQPEIKQQAEQPQKSLVNDIKISFPNAMTLFVRLSRIPNLFDRVDQF